MTGQEKAIEDRLIANIEKSLIGEASKRKYALDDYLIFQKSLAVKTFRENLGRDAGPVAEILNAINGN